MITFYSTICRHIQPQERCNAVEFSKSLFNYKSTILITGFFRPTEIIQLVKDGTKTNCFRPKIDETAFEVEDIKNIMIRCWAEDQCDRPDFGQLKSSIRKINK